EAKGDDFTARVEAGYRRVTEDFPDRCVAVDAEGAIDAVTARLLAVIDTRLGARLGLERGAAPGVGA
ncbi:MAG: hypothetical protein AAGC56_11985, partial [Pseudomonadota bacterium]